MGTARIIGISGKIASGKDELCCLLKERGYRELNLDHIGHMALEHQKEEIVECFGHQILNEKKHIERSRLAHIVFGKPSALKALEAIVHPWMKQYVIREIEKNPTELLCINAAVLFVIGLDVHCSLIFWLKVPFFQRMLRLYRRYGSWKKAWQRYWSQRHLRPKKKIPQLYTLYNNSSLEKLKMDLNTALEDFSRRH